MTPDPRPVLTRYPSAVANLAWVRLGAAGGFSGAVLWRGDLDGVPAFALKAWPPGYPFDRLDEIHRWMRRARDAGLAFVPAVVATRDGPTVVEYAGRVWDVVSWAPGAATFHAEPSDAKLAAACAALAALHRAWATPATTAPTCPAVQRRLDALRGRPFDPHIVAALAELAPWDGRPVSVQPCLCDVWHDHVLFTGDAVTGMIDYGAAKLDHPAADLARLLGDLVGDEVDRLRFGLEAYRAAGGPLPIDVELVTLLDRTGVLCAALHWQDCAKTGPLPERAADRLKQLLVRLPVLFPSAELRQSRGPAI